MEGSSEVRSWLRCYRCWSQNLELQVHYEGSQRIDADTGERGEVVDEMQAAVVHCMECMHDQPQLAFHDRRIEPVEDRWERMIADAPWVASCTVTVDVGADDVETCSWPEAGEALTDASFGDHGTREFFTHVRFHKHDEDRIVVRLLVELYARSAEEATEVLEDAARWRSRCSRRSHVPGVSPIRPATRPACPDTSSCARHVPRGRFALGVAALRSAPGSVLSASIVVCCRALGGDQPTRLRSLTIRRLLVRASSRSIAEASSSRGGLVDQRLPARWTSPRRSRSCSRTSVLSWLRPAARAAVAVENELGILRSAARRRSGRRSVRRSPPVFGAESSSAAAGAGSGLRPLGGSSPKRARQPAHNRTGSRPAGWTSSNRRQPRPESQTPQRRPAFSISVMSSACIGFSTFHHRASRTATTNLRTIGLAPSFSTPP